MKNERLFGIIYTLLSEESVTAKELADRFEVSTRTIYRDIDLLSSFNIPIYASKGKNGGISLLDNYKFDKSLLSKEEQNQILFALQSMKKLGVFEKDNTFAVLGIGINLYEPKNGFPEDISQIAGGIFTEKCSDDTKTELIAKVINNFYEFYSDLPQKAFLEDYRRKDMLCGKTVSYLKNGALFSGKAQGITENLELKVIDSFGNTLHLSSGEVTIGSKKA